MGGAISVPVKNHWLYDFSKSQTQEVWMGKLDIRRSTELTSPSPEIHLARRYKSFESEFKSEQCTVISINIGGGGEQSPHTVETERFSEFLCKSWGRPAITEFTGEKTNNPTEKNGQKTGIDISPKKI